MTYFVASLRFQTITQWQNSFGPTPISQNIFWLYLVQHTK